MLNDEVGPYEDLPDDGEYSESHNTQKVTLKTDKGDFTFTMHVYHNGYYGGFLIKCKEVK